MAISDNMSLVYNWYLQQGYSPTFSAGMAGNFAIETGGGEDIDPTKWSDDGTSFGIGQWKDERLKQLQKFADDGGYDINDIYTQLAFSDWELHNTEQEALKNIESSDLSSASGAAKAIASYYERCAPQYEDIRMAPAEDVFTSLYDGSDFDPYAVGGASASPATGTDTTDYTAELPDDMMGIDPSYYQRLGMLFKKARELGVEPLLTAGANDDSHVEGSYHYKGQGADIAWEGLQWGDDVLSQLADYARSLGFQEVISDPHGTGPHLHVANLDLSQQVQQLLGEKGDSYTFGEGAFQPKMQNTISPELYALSKVNADILNQNEEALKDKPSLLDGIWHDFKKSGNFLYELGDALYTDLFHSDFDAFGKSKITEEDKQYIMSAMGKGNEAEAQWIIDNAKDQTQLYYLLQRKMDDMQEDMRYAAYYNSLGAHSIGTVLGAVLDPLNLLPELKAVQAMKIIKATGGVIKNVKAIDSAAGAAVKQLGTKGKIANTALNMGMYGAIQQHAANKANTEDESIAGAALIAGVSGGVLRALGMAGGKVLSKKDASVRNIGHTAEKIEDATARDAVGLENAYTIMKDSKPIAAKMHDTSFLSSKGGSVAQKAEEAGNVYALSLEDAKKLGQRIGVSITDNTKGFYVPHGDYTVVVKDNVKSARQLEGVLLHEVGVHNSLKETLGDNSYNTLMNYVSEQAKDTTTPFAQAARMANSTDPEEILGYAIENDLLGKKSANRIVRRFKEGLKDLGVLDKTKFSNADIMGILKESVQYNRLKNMGIIVHSDGSITKGDVHFSKDNMMAPESLLDYENMAETQNKLDRPKSARGRVLDYLSKHMDYGAFTKTPYGVASRSPSPTLARKASSLLEDAQRRGKERTSNMLSAERQSQYLRSQLMKYEGAVLDARQQWIKDHYGVLGAINPFRGGDAHRQEFNKLVIDTFNHESKQGTLIDIDDSLIDDSVHKAVKALQDMYDARIELGKNSASMFGGDRKLNLIEKDWYAVDDEFHRLIDPDAYRSFVSNFTTTGDKGAKEFLEQYALVASNTPTSRQLISDMIYREKELAWKRQINECKEYLEKDGRKSARKVEEVKEKLKELEGKKPAETTEKEVDEYRTVKSKEWAEHAMLPLEDKLDGLDAKGASPTLGDLNFFKGRLPMDTGTVIPIRDAEGNIVSEFSFDKDLRYYDLDHILSRTNNRFSGEAAVRTVLGKDSDYQKFVSQVLKDFKMASMGSDGRISTAEAENRKTWFLDTLSRLRGMRDHYDRNVFGEAAASSKILNNLAYFKRGGSMGWNQLGDLGGAIAYGGLKQIFGVFNPLRKFVQECRLGTANNKFVEDLSWHVFGEPLERHIFRGSWGDMQVRQALSKRGTNFSNMLVGAADFTHNLSKFTSQINLLGHMTDTMVRSMRSGAITDSIRWAHGEQFNALRNPFSKANIKALGRQVDLEQLKKDLRTYINWDGRKGTIANGANIEKWQREHPDTFWAWYDLIQNQVEKGVLLSTSEGNRNLLKDHNALVRLVMMFKDFNFRSNNAQFMRALQQHELQDAVAFGLSMATNVGAFAARNAARMGALYAMGNTEAAEYVKENYLNDKALAKAAFLRTGFLSPASMINDVYESGTGSPTIRTTVTQYRNNPPKDVGDFIGNTVQQLPAVDTAYDLTWKPIVSAWKLANDKGSQRDLKSLLNLAPIPDFIPYTQAIETLSKLSGLPNK
ncbi:phage tail tip lysozyme [Megasphaera hexanoica]|uniref:Phage tail tip lysozyme n=1 Tax=Megasphaera hexanoica TaxID=1675036 RepID=A0ABW7DLR1_9FIRM|nr:phage tail tip lysozyme [Megasphaera hexanoica]AXB82002.1 hypothetical protein ACT01_06990 [Megasphaera hexanoica]